MVLHRAFKFNLLPKDIHLLSRIFEQFIRASGASQLKLNYMNHHDFMMTENIKYWNPFVLTNTKNCHYLTGYKVVALLMLLGSASFCENINDISVT